MSPSDDFQSYKQFERQMFKRSPADIVDRWKSRVIAHNLHNQGKLGAEIFLAKFGQNITEKKAVQWALKAEIEGKQDMANVFWEKAYGLKLNPPEIKSKKKKASSNNVSDADHKTNHVSIEVREKIEVATLFPAKTDSLTRRTWWHNVLQTHGKYTCCAFVLGLPADTETIKYLTEFGKELDLLSRRNCLVLAVTDTRAITYGVGENEWKGAIHEQVDNGQSLQIAKVFNINFAELPCMVIFRDIRSSEHLIVSLRKMEVDEISQVMRSVFDIIHSANSNKVDPLLELRRHRKKQEFQMMQKSVIGEVRKYLDITFEAAMQAHFQSSGKIT
jgi:hypothetical protein